MNNELEIPQNFNGIALFTGDGLDELLQHVTDKVAEFIPDTTTTTGRKAIASMAHRISKYKVALDDAGKALVADKKAEIKLVDIGRKTMRDSLDELKVKTRQPLTDWEAAEAERLATVKLAEEITVAHMLAIEENSLFDRQRELDRKELELAAQEQQRIDREAADLAEKHRLEREEQIRKDAEELAKREAEASALVEKEAAQRREIEAKLLAERAEREKLEAIEKAERDKKEAAEKAERDQREAVEKSQRETMAKIEAEQAEKQRQEAAAKREVEARAADRNHRKAVNNAALQAMEKNGIGYDTAKQVLTLIAKGFIPNVTIGY